MSFLASCRCCSHVAMHVAMHEISGVCVLHPHGEHRIQLLPARVFAPRRPSHRPSRNAGPSGLRKGLACRHRLFPARIISCRVRFAHRRTFLPPLAPLPRPTRPLSPLRAAGLCAPRRRLLLLLLLLLLVPEARLVRGPRREVPRLDQHTAHPRRQPRVFRPRHPPPQTPRGRNLPQKCKVEERRAHLCVWLL